MVDKKRYFKNNNLKLPFDCIYKTAHLKINMNGDEVLEYNVNKLIVNKYINKYDANEIIYIEEFSITKPKFFIDEQKNILFTWNYKNN